MRLSWIAVVVVALSFGCKKDEKKTPKGGDKADPAAGKTADPKPAPKPADPEPAKPAEPAAAELAVVFSHKVADFDTWKKAFDAHQDARKAAGVLGHHINQGADDPNMVTVYMPITDLEKLQAFAGGDDLKKAMKEAGVEGAPKMMVMKPVITKAVLDKPLAGMIVMHEVEDFAKWRTAYEGFDEARQKAGIVGHAVNQVSDNPNMVVVYHQAESMDALKKFMDSKELKEAMGKAGVKGKPEVSFHNGLAGAMY